MRGYSPRCVTSKSVCLDEFSVTHAKVRAVGSRPFSIAFSHVSQTSVGNITNISHVCQLESSPRVLAHLGTQGASRHISARTAHLGTSRHTQGASRHISACKAHLGTSRSPRPAGSRGDHAYDRRRGALPRTSLTLTRHSFTRKGSRLKGGVLNGLAKAEVARSQNGV